MANECLQGTVDDDDDDDLVSCDLAEMTASQLGHN